MSRIEVLTGPLAGRSFGLEEGGSLILGRKGADLDLGDPFVSDRHLCLETLDGGVRARDLGSRNRTFRNGLPLSEPAVGLSPSDLIRLGTTTLRLGQEGEGPEEWVELPGGRGRTLDLGSFLPGREGPAWLDRLGRVLISPVGGGELLDALCRAAVEEGPFARIAFGEGGSPSPRAFAGRCASGFPLLREPSRLSRETGEPALVVDMALDPSEPSTPKGQLFCSAAFAPLPLPGTRAGRARTAWIYGDTLGEGHSLQDGDLEALAQLGRCMLGIRKRLPLHAELHRALEREETRFLGNAESIRSLLAQAAKIAPSDLTLLLLGETGTGKEVLARIVHELGPRREAPFVTVNCAALPEALAESLLFGHRRGAFTGAEREERGLFRRAEGGSLFLDEVSELPPPLQAKLLRMLQEKEVQPLGESDPVPVDVRILAATNRELEAEVREGRFREDLYWRLCGMELRLPPLREHPEDILLLARFFLDSACRKEGRPSMRLSKEAERRLLAHSWPGNVRELRHVLHGAVLLSEGGRIQAGSLRLGPGERGEGVLPLREMERRQIRRALAATGGNKAAAARLLGVDRSTLYDKIRGHGLETGAERE